MLYFLRDNGIMKVLKMNLEGDILDWSVNLNSLKQMNIFMTGQSSISF